MKKVKKILAIVLATAMMAYLLSGCASNKEANADDQVTLRWVLMGDKMEDSDEVWAAFNEKLKEKLPNTQVTFNVIPSSDFAEKWQLMMSARESIDLAWNGWVQDFKEEVRRGSYMELSELLEQYGSNIKAAVPDYVWEDQMVDGKLYFMPNMQMMVNRPSHLFTSGSKADAYLDKERLQKAFADNAKQASSITGETVLPGWSDEIWDTLEEYLENLKNAGRLGLGLNPGILGWVPPVTAQKVVEPVCYIVQDASGKYIAKAIQAKDSPYRKEYERMTEFYQKGYIRKDIQTATPSAIDNTPEEGYVFRMAAGDEYSVQIESLKAGEPIFAVSTRPDGKFTRFGEVSNTNTTIPTTAKNPVRAMQLYNLINSETDTELYNLLVYGLEGKHYEKTAENAIRTFEPVKYSLRAWVVGNALNAYDTQTSIPGYNDYTKNVLNNPENIDMTTTPLSDFEFDTTPVKSVLVQINSVLGEYKDLEYGTTADWEARCSEMESKLERVGIDKVVAELQKQLDEKINNR